MKRILLSLLLAAVGLSEAAAQEVQVPLDRSGAIMVIDRGTEDFSEIFPEYRGFQEARLFRTGEDAYVLEVLYRPADETLRERRVLTEAEVAVLRDRVSAALPAASAAGLLDQSGRARLLRQVAVTSLLLYGPALPVVLDIDDESLGGALYLATASAGFFVPFFLTRDRPVSQGAASLSRVGAGHGALHGLALALFVSADDVSGRAAYGLTALGSAAEAYLGYRFATRTDITRGTAETIGNTALYGTVAGLALGGIFSVAPEENTVPEGDAVFTDEAFFEKNIRIFSGAALVGSAAGMYLGYRLARGEAYTRGDGRVLATAGALGVNAAILAIDLTDVDNGRVASGIVAAGTGAGLVAGRLLTRGRDFTTGQGAYIALGTAAGALGGSALAALLDAEPTPAYVLGSLGATVGFGLLYRAYVEEARRTAAGRTMGSLEFEVNPLGVMGALGAGPAAAGRLEMPMFRIAAGGR